MEYLYRYLQDYMHPADFCSRYMHTMDRTFYHKVIHEGMLTYSLPITRRIELSKHRLSNKNHHIYETVIHINGKGPVWG